ncbi:MAG: LruC domain-containing protein [Bacteroidia bacterium]|nr:LruC domain-containing protein [Bacteroidia bacterium]
MKKIALTAFIALSLMACKKLKPTESVITPTSDVTDVNQMVIPKGFNYKTSDNVEFNITLLANDDKPLKGVRIDLMDKAPEDGGIIYMTGTTDANGVMNIKREMALYIKSVIINTDYIGIPNNVIGDINSGKVILTLGGKNPPLIVTADVAKYHMNTNLGKAVSQYSYRLGRYSTGSNGGVPNYLISPNDVVSSTFLADVNASLPESQPVPSAHPGYLAANVERNLILTQQCDVWVTFVHEGAGYKNSLFYFIYNKNSKPTTLSQIDSLITIFPNASYNGSGGGLAAGNKVYLGHWGADTCIGFAIASNAWNGTTPGAGLYTYTTIKSMNPETNAANKEHVVLLYDNPTQRFLIGFEDLNRDAGSDNDFNDAVIYATASPLIGIDKTNVLPVTPSADSDNDGVGNAYDEYPLDAARAFNVYYPSATTMASVAFEDLWPSKGDYDLNDVVVDYRYHAVTNGANQIKDLNAKFKLRAAGGVFKNAFSVEFPFTKSNVTVKPGTTAIGLETGATAAILKVFSNSKDLISTYNTLEGKSWVETDTIYSFTTLTSPVIATLGTFNPFIYINEADKGRGYEVHLAGKTPTELVSTTFLGTNDDATNNSAGVYFKTASGLPFAISTPEKFDYPWERTQIVLAHLKFAAWAQSGGAQYPDWYKNLTNYRNATKIYVKP